MGAMPNEPSMEEILSSIKRIIAEEDGASQPPRAPRRTSPVSLVETAPAASGPDDETADDLILELTDALPGDQDVAAPVQEEPVMTAPAQQPERKAEPKAAEPKAEAKPEAKPARAETKPPRARTPAPAPAPTGGVMSDDVANAARDSLVNLSKLLVTPEEGQSNTLEGLVKEMLRPMLKDWLDAHLPDMVESLVKREIDRITGRV